MTPGAPLGKYRLIVITNGIPSEACRVTVTPAKRVKELKAEIKEKFEIVELQKRVLDVQKLPREVDDKVFREEFEVFERFEEEWLQTVRSVSAQLEEVQQEMTRSFIKPEERPDVGVPEPEIEPIEPRFRGVYLRPGEPPAGRARGAAMLLLALASALRGVVVNRPAAGRSNASKPYHLGLIARAGLRVPDTLVTTDPAAARAFLREHGRLIYKSVSGIRSIVATLGADDEARLDDVVTGPVQLQECVPGLDVRVHVVGERWFACAVTSAAADYRYAGAAGTAAVLSALELPGPLGRQLLALVRGMNLLVAGVDLRRTPDGSWVCFEVNPSPGFTWYEEATGHPIAEAVADLLLS